MTVSPVKQGWTLPQAVSSAPNQESPAAAKPKKDTLVLSEKAKDLAAKLAGKGLQEESNESMSAKAMEGE